MKVNKWTMGLAALGLISIPATSSAEEGQANGVLTALSSTTISGYVNTSIHWNTGTGNESLPAHSYTTASTADGARRTRCGPGSSTAITTSRGSR